MRDRLRELESVSNSCSEANSASLSISNLSVDNIENNDNKVYPKQDHNFEAILEEVKAFN